MRAASHTHCNHRVCVPLRQRRSAGLWEGLSIATNANEFWQPSGTVGSLRTVRDGEKWLGLYEEGGGRGRKDGRWRQCRNVSRPSDFGGYDLEIKVGCSGVTCWTHSSIEITCLELVFRLLHSLFCKWRSGSHSRNLIKHHLDEEQNKKTTNVAVTQLLRNLSRADSCESCVFLVAEFLGVEFSVENFPPLLLSLQTQSATRAWERTTKESSRGPDPICHAPPGVTTAAGQLELFQKFSKTWCAKNKSLLTRPVLAITIQKRLS